MLRTATILVVFCTSLMLGKAPCCRLHDFSAPVHTAIQAGSPDRETRGPGEYVCPCCEKPKKQDGQPVPHISKPCNCPPLIASIAADADAVDLPLALPSQFAVLPMTIGDAWNGAFVNLTRAPPTAYSAVTLPLLL